MYTERVCVCNFLIYLYNNRAYTMTDEQKEYLSREKYEELKQELEHLKKTRRKEIAEALEYARSLGDLSENAEYHEARGLQVSVEERIQKLESVLANAEIISDAKKSTAVSLGATVTLQKAGEKKERIYKIVGSEEANTLEGKISHLSPLGRALMGKKKDDTCSFETPNGTQKYKVVKVN